MASARTLKLGIAALASLLVVSCADADNPLQPAQQPLSAKGGIAVSGRTYQAVARANPAGTVTDRQVISADNGGTISAGGVSLQFDGGELSRDRPIQLTVPAGDFLEARFSPHGLQFDEPATLCFDLSSSSVDADDLVGVYLGNKGIDASGRITDPEETIDVEYDEANGIACILIKHFSGYIVASGRR